MEALGSQVLPTAAQQLDGADPASQVFGFGAILALAGRAAHLEAVRHPRALHPPARRSSRRWPWLAPLCPFPQAGLSPRPLPASTVILATVHRIGACRA